jgi:hypothetical protein
MAIVLLFLADCYATNQLDIRIVDLSFGRRQVEQIVLDQPDIGRVIRREPALREILECRFSGSLQGARVYWDHRETVGGRPAEHLPTFFGYPPLIRISRRFGTSAVDKCAMLLFELNNLEIDREYQLLLSAPVGKRKSREEFALACVRIEFEAMNKTRSFFETHPIRSANIDKDPNYYATLRSGNDFAAYLRWLDQRDASA